MRLVVPRWLLTIIALVAASLAQAHDPKLSGIRVVFEKNRTVVTVQAHGSLLVDRKQLADSGKRDQALRAALHERLKLELDGSPFAPENETVSYDEPNDLVMYQAESPAAATHAGLAARLFPEDAAARTALTLIRDGVVFDEVLLDQEHPSYKAGTSSSWLVVAWRYLEMGVQHVWSGADHVAFILGLILIGTSIRGLLRAVTAFTLSHSVTLAIAATGWWVPPSRWVEPLIALSIVVVAIQSIRTQSRSLENPPAGDGPRKDSDARTWIAFSFGLVHGFGFAGALVDVGLPQGSLLTALLAFNVGVEVAQATIVLTAAPLCTWMLRRWPKASFQLFSACSWVIVLAGTYWFVQRVLGA